MGSDAPEQITKAGERVHAEALTNEVAMILAKTAAVCPPLSLPLNIQFSRPTAIPRRLRSANWLIFSPGTADNRYGGVCHLGADVARPSWPWSGEQGSAEVCVLCVPPRLFTAPMLCEGPAPGGQPARGYGGQQHAVDRRRPWQHRGDPS